MSTTAYTELKLRARGQAHDVHDPVTTDSPAAVDNTVTGKDVAERAVSRKVYHLCLGDDADATTARNYLAFLGIPASEYPNGAEIISVKMRSAAITSHADNWFLDTFTQYSSAGVAGNTVATLTSDSDVAVASGGLVVPAGASVAGKPYSAFLTATLADRRIVPNGSLGLSRTKNAAGVTLGEMTYEIVVEAL